MSTDTTEAALEACIRKILNAEFGILNSREVLPFAIQDSGLHILS